MQPILQKLQQINPDLAIKPVSDPGFARYGRVVNGLGGDLALTYARRQAAPGSGVVYEPAVPGLEADAALAETASRIVYGGMPVQIGWCYGRNDRLNGLEYHKGVEVIVPVTDVVLLLGRVDDIQWNSEPSYDTSLVEAFYAPAGSSVELSANCLHYAPVHTSDKEGFVTLIILPRRTNTALDAPVAQQGENRLLFARNKWLLVHPEDAGDVQAGAFVGLRGVNIRVKTLD